MGFLGRYTKFVNLTAEAVSEARDNRPGRPPAVNAAAVAAAVGTGGAETGGVGARPAAPADEGTFGGTPADPFGGDDFGLPAPPPDAYGDVT